MRELFTLAGAVAAAFSACGGDGHVSGEVLPLVDGASIAKSRESPGATTYTRHLLVEGPDDVSATQLREDEGALMEEEGWRTQKPDDGRFGRFEVQALSPDDEVLAYLVTSRHAKRLAQLSGYNFTWSEDARELRREGIPTLYALMPATGD